MRLDRELQPLSPDTPEERLFRAVVGKIAEIQAVLTKKIESLGASFDPSVHPGLNGEEEISPPLKKQFRSQPGQHS